MWSVSEHRLNFEQMQEHQEQEAAVLKEPVQQEWVDYPTAERFSGLSHTSLWRRVRSGEIKSARIGRSVRINLPSLREFMERASEDAVGE